jgi:hypothetical protein
MINSSHVGPPTLGVVLGVCLVAAIATAVTLVSTRERSTPGPADPALTHTAVVPPIDASAPVYTETATFALG